MSNKLDVEGLVMEHCFKPTYSSLRKVINVMDVGLTNNQKDAVIMEITPKLMGQGGVEQFASFLSELMQMYQYNERNSNPEDRIAAIKAAANLVDYGMYYDAIRGAYK